MFHKKDEEWTCKRDEWNHSDIILTFQYLNECRSDTKRPVPLIVIFLVRAWLHVCLCICSAVLAEVDKTSENRRREGGAGIARPPKQLMAMTSSMGKAASRPLYCISPCSIQLYLTAIAIARAAAPNLCCAASNSIALPPDIAWILPPPLASLPVCLELADREGGEVLLSRVQLPARVVGYKIHPGLILLIIAIIILFLLQRQETALSDQRFHFLHLNQIMLTISKCLHTESNWCVVVFSCWGWLFELPDNADAFFDIFYPQFWECFEFLECSRDCSDSCNSAQLQCHRSAMRWYLTAPIIWQGCLGWSKTFWWGFSVY